VSIHSLTDAEQPALLERLGQDHARIAQMISRLGAATDQLEFAASEDVDALWDEIANAMDFLKHYADRVHHPLEDRLFDALLHKGLTPTERHLVFRNLGQHQEIMTLTESMLAQIHLARTNSVVDPAAFGDQVAEYLALQRRHMTFEETHMFPLLMARLDNSDWNKLHQDLGKHFGAPAS
jgi:hemerythrin-like domain-containing protein